jgi:hypothetical protein
VTGCGCALGKKTRRQQVCGLGASDFLCQRKLVCSDIWGRLSAKQCKFCDKELVDSVIILNAGMDGMAIESMPVAFYGHINARLVLV